MTLAS
ncbi:Protein of unknown function [Propionibacterium freudenreichii]